MGIPGPCPDIEGDCIFHVLGLFLEDPQPCEDVVSGINDVVLDFDIKEEIEVEVKTESDRKLKGFSVLPSYTMLPCPQEQYYLGSGQSPGMTEGAAVHLLHCVGKVSRFHSRHQFVAHLRICTLRVHYILWYVDYSLAPRNCPEVGIVGHFINLVEEGTHRTSEPLVRACWSINVSNEVTEGQLIGMKRADAPVEPLCQHLSEKCIAASLPPRVHFC